VETAEGHLDPGALDAHREAVESLELDARRSDLRLRALEVSVGTVVDTVVAHVDRIEDQARSTYGARPSVGCMGQRFGGDRGVLESVPERLAGKAEADLGHARVVGVEDDV